MIETRWDSADVEFSSGAAAPPVIEVATTAVDATAVGLIERATLVRISEVATAVAVAGDGAAVKLQEVAAVVRKRLRRRDR